MLHLKNGCVLSSIGSSRNELQTKLLGRKLSIETGTLVLVHMQYCMMFVCINKMYIHLYNFIGFMLLLGKQIA